MTRTVVVTGGSAGIGRAAAARFAKNGDRVVVLARGRAGLDAAVDDITRAGGEGLALEVDVADQSAVEAAASSAEARFGPIDVWVNNAMATVFGPVASLTPENVRRATEVTYLGSVWGTMAALRRMTPRDRGVVVQVGSALSYRAIPLQAPYCGAKFALRGFTDSLRSELHHMGSRVEVTMVQLPAVNTPQFSWAETTVDRHPRPVAPVFAPQVAADAIVAAANRPRREYWLGFRNVLTMIGASIAPGALDRFLGETAYEGQQLGRTIDSDRPSNLFGPVDSERDYGAGGIFSDEEATHSLQLALTTLRPAPGLLQRPLAAVLRRVLG